MTTSATHSGTAALTGPVGLDIGGANLKASDGMEQTVTREFPLWKSPDKLPEALAELLAGFSPAAPLAVTMTGELADCFRTRADGVKQILEAVAAIAGDREIMVWQTTGEFVSPEDACEFPQLVAAANWHALASWAGRISPVGASLLIDIGSTTTDIIPLEDGTPIPAGRTDLERLESGELIYLGVRRTPICGLISEVRLGTRCIGLARELFATTFDVHLWLQHMAEEPDNRQTANGGPGVVAAAGDRLARMICADRDVLTDEEIQVIAVTVHRRELEILQHGLKRVLSRMEAPHQILLSGEGEFLALQLLKHLKSSFHQAEITVLGSVIGPAHSRGACAFALARLARERRHAVSIEAERLL